MELGCDDFRELLRKRNKKNPSSEESSSLLLLLLLLEEEEEEEEEEQEIEEEGEKLGLVSSSCSARFFLLAPAFARDPLAAGFFFSP